jgi:hypothetical protein
MSQPVPACVQDEWVISLVFLSDQIRIQPRLPTKEMSMALLMSCPLTVERANVNVDVEFWWFLFDLIP